MLCPMSPIRLCLAFVCLWVVLNAATTVAVTPEELLVLRDCKNSCSKRAGHHQSGFRDADGAPISGQRFFSDKIDHALLRDDVRNVWEAFSWIIRPGQAVLLTVFEAMAAAMHAVEVQELQEILNAVSVCRNEVYMVSCDVIYGGALCGGELSTAGKRCLPGTLPGVRCHACPPGTVSGFLIVSPILL